MEYPGYATLHHGSLLSGIRNLSPRSWSRSSGRLGSVGVLTLHGSRCKCSRWASTPGTSSVWPSCCPSSPIAASSPSPPGRSCTPHSLLPSACHYSLYKLRGYPHRCLTRRRRASHGRGIECTSNWPPCRQCPGWLLNVCNKLQGRMASLSEIGRPQCSTPRCQWPQTCLSPAISIW